MALGRQVRGFAQDVWVEHRRDVVVRGNLAADDERAAWRGLNLLGEALMEVRARLRRGGRVTR